MKRKPKPPTVPHIPAPGWQQYTPPVGSSFACCCGKAPTWHSGGMIRCDTCVPSASTVAAIVCADCGETGHARCGLAPPAPTVEGGAKSCATCAHCTAWPGSSPCNSCMRDAAYPNWQPGPAPPPPDDLGEDIGTWTEPGNIPAVFSIRGKPRIYVYNDRPWRVFDERGVCVKVGDDIAPRKRESIAALRAELEKKANV